MFRFEKLEVWKISIKYANQIYDLAENLPKNEEFGLKSQIKRAALSISSNIAEGSGSSSNKDFSHFLDIAIKSVIETVSQLLFAYDRGMIDSVRMNELKDQAEVLVRKIQSLKQYLKSPRANTHLPRAIQEVRYE